MSCNCCGSPADSSKESPQEPERSLEERLEAVEQKLEQLSAR